MYKRQPGARGLYPKSKPPFLRVVLICTHGLLWDLAPPYALLLFGLSLIHISKKKRRTVMHRAKGYYGAASRTYKHAKEQVQHSLQYQYRDCLLYTSRSPGLRTRGALATRRYKQAAGLFA